VRTNSLNPRKRIWKTVDKQENADNLEMGLCWKRWRGGFRCKRAISNRARRHFLVERYKFFSDSSISCPVSTQRTLPSPSSSHFTSPIPICILPFFSASIKLSPSVRPSLSLSLSLPSSLPPSSFFVFLAEQQQNPKKDLKYQNWDPGGLVFKSSQLQQLVSK